MNIAKKHIVYVSLYQLPKVEFGFKWGQTPFSFESLNEHENTARKKGSVPI